MFSEPTTINELREDVGLPLMDDPIADEKMVTASWGGIVPLDNLELYEKTFGEQNGKESMDTCT